MMQQILSGVYLGVGFALGSGAIGLVSAVFRWAYHNPAPPHPKRPDGSPDSRWR